MDDPLTGHGVWKNNNADKWLDDKAYRGDYLRIMHIRRGRPKKTWNQQLKDDMTAVGVTQDMALDRTEWRRRTRPTPTR